MTVKTDYKSMAIFERPIEIDPKIGGKIYGMMFSPEQEQHYERRFGENGRISSYITFLLGVEKFLKGGGIIEDDFKTWRMTNDMCLTGYIAIAHLFRHLFKDEVKFNVLELDEPIQYEEGEVDDVEPRCIISQTLIDRYTKKCAEKQ